MASRWISAKAPRETVFESQSPQPKRRPAVKILVIVMSLALATTSAMAHAPEVKAIRRDALAPPPGRSPRTGGVGADALILIPSKPLAACSPAQPGRFTIACGHRLRFAVSP